MSFCLKRKPEDGILRGEIVKRRITGIVGMWFAALCAWGLSALMAPGHFALQGGIPKTEGHLRLTAISGDPLYQHIDLWMTAPHSNRPIQSYAVEMTKRLHLVIVSSDFSIFLHEHPQLGPDGHFTLDEKFPTSGLYYLYADGEPEGLDHQVFRFDAAVSAQAQPKPRILAPTGPTVPVGPYTVELSSTRLSAGGMDMLNVHILKNGKPARDLHPYLGALAHAVFLNGKDLSYVHVHPMAMGRGTSMDRMAMNGSSLPDNAVSSPDMMLHVELQEPGTYKLWLQFHGGSQLYVAPFVLTAH